MRGRLAALLIRTTKIRVRRRCRADRKKYKTNPIWRQSKQNKDVAPRGAGPKTNSFGCSLSAAPAIRPAHCPAAAYPQAEAKCRLF
jgi:hypothetical protein